jgi:hypothetical protein
MYAMIRRASTFYFVVLLLSGFFSLPVFAQDDGEEAARRAAAAAEEARQEALRQQQERAAQEASRKVMEQSQNSMREFLNDTRETLAQSAAEMERRREMQRRAEYTLIKDGFQRFEVAREQLSHALGFKAKLKVPAKELEKSAVVFLDFIKQRGDKSQRPRLDATQFKNFKPSELGWEALTTAERVASQLSAILKSEEDGVVDINFLMSLSKVETELLRLQWMTKKLK